jgi:hypothetical protein
MNIQSPQWASYFPNAPTPLSSGLSAVFKPDHETPSELQRLLDRVSGTPGTKSAANNNDRLGT